MLNINSRLIGLIVIVFSLVGSLLWIGHLVDYRMGDGYVRMIKESTLKLKKKHTSEIIITVHGMVNAALQKNYASYKDNLLHLSEDIAKNIKNNP